MTPNEEILTLINAHPEARALADSGADNACAAWLTENTGQYVDTGMVSDALMYEEGRFPTLNPESPEYVAPGSIPPVPPAEEQEEP